MPLKFAPPTTQPLPIPTPPEVVDRLNRPQRRVSDLPPAVADLGPDEIFVGYGTHAWSNGATGHEHWPDAEASKVPGRLGGLDPERGVVKCETCAFAADHASAPLTTVTASIDADLALAAKRSAAAVGKSAADFWQLVIATGLEALGVRAPSTAHRRGAR
jgi:hypothetical protein